MKRSAIALLLLAGCGDEEKKPVVYPEPDAAMPLTATCDEQQLAVTLRALPNVKDVDEQPDCGQYVMGQARCFRISFDQPIQHTGGGPRFQQQLYLIHRGCDRPTIVADWGYENSFFFDDELSALYSTNALWVEHRFQGASVPSDDNWDWTALTIRNGAADMHEIVSSFRKHYGQHFVSTGASKGGITATYHHFLYPNDLDGAIPYVAPASRWTIDAAYQTFLSSGFPPCAQQLRDAQVAALTTRKSMMLQKLSGQTPPGYEIKLLEAMTSSTDWGFWQYYGVQYCQYVPTAQSSDQDFFDFFYEISGFGGGSQAAPAVTNEERSWLALYYEWLTEQGFALQMGSHVASLVHEPETLATMEDYFKESLPEVDLPAYNGGLTQQVRAWAKTDAKNMLLIYGQYDPWSGGAMDAPTQESSARYFVPAATHGAQMMRLPTAERTAALGHATRMLGVQPVMAMAHLATGAGANRAQIVEQHARNAYVRMTKQRLGR